MTTFHFASALLPDGWSEDVRVTVDERGDITTVERGVAETADVMADCALPGMANLHSHAFQRGMAGLSERRGSATDTFWSWREVMYAFNDALTPDHVEAIAALAYCEMLETGFTAVGEFHYLHHDRDGRPFADLAEMAGRVCAAARQAGIALTLLPVFYRYADFHAVEPSEEQRRFINDLNQFAELVERARDHVLTTDHAVLGLAPHSLRAAGTEEITEIRTLWPNGPFHIHVAEQMREVEACRAATGKRPVELLLDTFEIDHSWCLVHATHINAGELAGISAANAVVGLCPATEANLGDGIFPAAQFAQAGGRWGVGTDSHIRIDLPEELRLLEYGQRLVREERNVLGGTDQSTGQAMFHDAASGGAQALHQPTGRISAGARADFVLIDTNDPLFAGRSGEALVDTWLFCGDSRQVREVYVGGQRVVADGRALYRAEAERLYRRAIREIMGALDR